MRIGKLKSEKGTVLVVVMFFTLILTVLGFSVLSVADSEIVLTWKDIDKTKAFYLAEAGVGILNTRLRNGIFASIEDTPLGGGSYRVDYYPGADPPYAIVTGTVRNQKKKIKVVASFLAPPYEYGIYAGGSGGEAWTLMLRGIGNPVVSGGKESGGKDIISGNLFINGDVALYQESRVNPPLAPNTYGLKGDATATGNINVFDTAAVSGVISEHSALEDSPDLVGMNYAVNNTHNVSKIFADAGVSSGYLPSSNPLRNVFVKNPSSNRKKECDSTPVDDYFFEPSTGFVFGTEKTGETPIHAGNNRVYYVDGDVWVHSEKTYGFKMDGKVTIVATGNIHICDNIQYKDANSLLGLVALGKYDSSDQLISGGNVFFGDPAYGTMYTISAMMFAANNFLYNTTPLTGMPEEPTSGFIVNGNLSALNRVSIERDWYTKEGSPPTRKPARYDPATSKWVDSVTGTVLTSTQIGTIKHYQMILNYDDRVRTWLTQPPGLPRGVGTIFEGLRNWEELP